MGTCGVTEEILDERVVGPWRILLAVRNYRPERLLVIVERVAGIDEDADDPEEISGGCVGFATDPKVARQLFDSVSLTVSLLAGEQPELVDWAEIPEGAVIT